MDITTLGSLLLLALIDSTSFGTLLIPLWLLMVPGRIRLGRVLVFLGTVTSAYFLIGLALLAGATVIFDVFEGVQDTRGFLTAQLVLGVVLVAISFWMDPPRDKASQAGDDVGGGTAPAGPKTSSQGRIHRWRARAMGDTGQGQGSMTALLLLAGGAVVLELVTMLPYLAGIGIISAQGPGWPQNTGLLAGYCLVMIAPAALLALARLALGSAVEGPLRSLEGWLSRNAQSTTAWVIGIAGALLGVNALGQL